MPGRSHLYKRQTKCDPISKKFSMQSYSKNRTVSQKKLKTICFELSSAKSQKWIISPIKGGEEISCQKICNCQFEQSPNHMKYNVACSSKDVDLKLKLISSLPDLS